jgi:hypothetical protein
MEQVEQQALFLQSGVALLGFREPMLRLGGSCKLCCLRGNDSSCGHGGKGSGLVFQSDNLSHAGYNSNTSGCET